ncbi:MAG: hypothetical protein L0Y60_04340 [Beijerinckiaceae bacterium]|nr:hypothetical protein [Beijerinckiaceae bacterium]
MAKISSIMTEFTPEYVSVHFETLPRLDIVPFEDKSVNGTAVSVTEIAGPRYLQPISLFFKAEHHDRIERAVEAFNAVIADAEGGDK